MHIYTYICVYTHASIYIYIIYVHVHIYNLICIHTICVSKYKFTHMTHKSMVRFLFDTH